LFLDGLIVFGLGYEVLVTEFYQKLNYVRDRVHKSSLTYRSIKIFDDFERQIGGDFFYINFAGRFVLEGKSTVGENSEGCNVIVFGNSFVILAHFVDGFVVEINLHHFILASVCRASFNPSSLSKSVSVISTVRHNMPQLLHL
jgi:hypothetical protein